MSKRKRILAALSNVNMEIRDLSSGGKYAAGLGSEGYAGGYRDALNDVLLVLNNVPPTRRNYWKDWK